MCFKITIDSSVQVWTSQYLLITSGACFKWPTSHTPCREKETPAMRTFRRIQLQSSALQRKFLQLQWKRQQLPRLNLHNGYLSLLNHRVFILFFFSLCFFVSSLKSWLSDLFRLEILQAFLFFSPPSDNLVICLQINCKRFTVHLKAKRIHISQLPRFRHTTILLFILSQFNPSALCKGRATSTKQCINWCLTRSSQPKEVFNLMMFSCTGLHFTAFFSTFN